ncbi:MAG: D-2-hydroxyacid dehydrogenase [Candidatus Binatales bacterium]
MKIACAVPLTPPQRRMLQESSPDAEIRDRLCRSADDTAELMRGGCDVLLGFRIPENPRAIAPDLKWIQLLSAGADRALGGTLRDAPIAVTTASGIHATPIGEYIVASMLAYAHGLHTAIRAQLKREWIRQGGFAATIDELRGKTLGVIGYGSIGREAARIADAFGMSVLALKREPDKRADPGWVAKGLGDPEGRIPARFFGPDERVEILAQSDYVAVTLPGTPHTRGFIGAREIAAMKPAAYIVNIGRGAVIDQAALIEALKAKRIGGAGLDVFEREPLEAESPLWELDNAILTPHISGANRDYIDKACELFAENLRRFSSGQPLLNLLDPELGY